jgi:SPP1 gp7 family putative phage head morphogenesis protein
MGYQEDARGILDNFLSSALKREKKEMLLLSNKWQIVQDSLQEKITKLSNLEEISKDKLFKLDLYKQFLLESKTQVDKYSKLAEGIISGEQLEFAKLGLEVTQETLGLITVNFGRMNISAVENMIGLSSDSSPLSKLLIKSYPETVQKLTNTLINNTALGVNPLVTAREMSQNMNGNLTRALVIARTEQMNVLRETSLMQMEDSGVCKGWIRIEQSDCCPECEPLNGQHFSFDDDFDTHPNCRGATIPDI